MSSASGKVEHPSPFSCSEVISITCKGTDSSYGKTHRQSPETSGNALQCKEDLGEHLGSSRVNEVIECITGDGSHWRGRGRFCHSRDVTVIDCEDGARDSKQSSAV
jgi:hypothetical protein